MMYQQTSSTSTNSERVADYKIRSNNLGLFTVINFLKISTGFMIPYICSTVLSIIVSILCKVCKYEYTTLQLVALDRFLGGLIPFWFNFMYLYRDLKTHTSDRSRVLLILQALILNTVVEYSGTWGLPFTLRPLYKIFMIFKLTPSWGPELCRVSGILIGLKFFVGVILGPGRENLVYTQFESTLQKVLVIVLAGLTYYIYCKTSEYTVVALSLATVSVYNIITGDQFKTKNFITCHIYLWLIIYLIRKLLLWSTIYAKIYHAQKSPPRDIPSGVWNEFAYFSLDNLTLVGLILLILEGIIVNTRYLKVLPLRVRIRQFLLTGLTTHKPSKTLTFDLVILFLTVLVSALGGCLSNSLQSYITSSVFVKKVIFLDPTEIISPAISHSLKVDYRYLSNSNRFSHITGFNKRVIDPNNLFLCATMFTVDVLLELFTTELILVGRPLNF